MINQLVLVGRLEELSTKDGDIIMIESDSVVTKKSTTFPVHIPSEVHQSLVESATIGDMIAIKGRLDMCENGITIVAEKLSILSRTGEQ